MRSFESRCVSSFLVTVLRVVQSAILLSKLLLPCISGGLRALLRRVRVLYDAAVSPSAIFGALTMAAAGNQLRAHRRPPMWSGEDGIHFLLWRVPTGASSCFVC